MLFSLLIFEFIFQSLILLGFLSLSNSTVNFIGSVMVSMLTSNEVDPQKDYWQCNG